jgi:CubicO group peptidase (beta-lactamase class C family)
VGSNKDKAGGSHSSLTRSPGVPDELYDLGAQKQMSQQDGCAGGRPTMSSGGSLSAEGLARLHDAMADHVGGGAMPGLITLVARGNTAQVDVIGARAFDDPEPMPRDAVFRIASLSKPITSVAAMMLVDDGVLHLDAPVDHWLPELADRRVLRTLDSKLDDTVRAVRPITLDDLLTFRLGFGCIMAPPDTYPIQTAEEELQLRTLGPPWPPTPHSPDEWIALLGTLPLMHQPGEEWMYNTGTQVLGILLERASGQPLETFLRERVFGPLGMKDTGFSLLPGQAERFTTAYAPEPESGALHVLDGVEHSWWSRPPALPNAAGWLLSTIDDYWAFVQLLTTTGRYRGERLLSEASVKLMTTDHLTPEQRTANTMFLGNAGGWGLGLLVPAAGAPAAGAPAAGAPAAGAPAPGVPGGFGWDGGTGTTWRSDPENGLTGILFTQRAMTSPEPPAAFVDFWTGAYGALAD